MHHGETDPTMVAINRQTVARVIVALKLIVAATASAAAPGRSSAIAVTPDGTRIAVVNPDSSSVTIIEAATRAVRAEIATGGTPQTVFIAPNGALLVATGDALRVIDLGQLRVAASIAAGNDEFGVVADDERIYVSVTGSAHVRVFAQSTRNEIARIRTDAAPRGLAIDPEHHRLYVTHLLSGALSIVDTATLAVVKRINLGADEVFSQALVDEPATRRLYLPRTRANSFNTALQFDTTVFPVVAVVNTDNETIATSEQIFLDRADRPVNMPLDAVLAAGGRLYVVNAGSDDVSVVDVGVKQAVAHIAVGRNPRGIALSPDGATAYVNNTLSGSVTFIDTATNAVTATVKSTTIPLRDDILLGKILFNTSDRPSLSKDRWLSCATCHFDGFTDNRTWFFRDGPRNTPSLFGAASTLPLHWSGDLDELQDVELTIRLVQFGNGLLPDNVGCTPACDAGPPNAHRSQDLDALAEYMRSLAPPHVEMDFDPAAARRGATLFTDPRVGCVACHPAPLYTDRQKHDVGTGRTVFERKGSSFDTPSLRGVFATAPYLHDGSAPTLAALVRGATGQHGNTAGLKQEELDDLVEFLRSIPFNAPPRRRAAAH